MEENNSIAVLSPFELIKQFGCILQYSSPPLPTEAIFQGYEIF